jgi:hypothetical protein
LLAAGESRRVLVDLVRQTDLVQHRYRLFHSGGTRELAYAHRGQDVLQHGHVREEVELLEHHAHLCAHPTGVRGSPTIMPSTTIRPLVSGSRALMQRSSVLARSARADDHEAGA